MFTTTKKNPVKVLQEKSQSAISIFDKTKNDLAQINESINQEEQVRQSEIERLKEELAQLGTQKASNSKVIGKIEEFLAD